MNPGDTQWLGFLGKLGIGAGRQTQARTEEFLPEGFERSNKSISINVDDIPADFLPMTVRLPEGVVFLLQGEIIVFMDDGAIHHLTHDGGLKSQFQNISALVAKDKEQVQCKWLTQLPNWVVHKWMFVGGGILTFEVHEDDVVRNIRALGLQMQVDKTGCMTFWENVRQ